MTPNPKLKISIVTPTFNSKRTVERTILSVIAQRSTVNLEYIIVDGGSTDGTLDLLKQYQTEIDLLISEPDHGPYDAMNKGISAASGEVIGIINSDDWYNEGALQQVMQTFEQDATVDVVYSPVENYYEEVYVARFMPGRLDKLPIRFTLNHPSCFIRKSVYQQFGLYNTQYQISADHDLLLRLYMAGCNFRYIASPLASYSLNGLSSSTKLADRMQLIWESWQIGGTYVEQLPAPMQRERQQAYIAWVLHEMIALPTRRLLKPPLARKLKAFLMQFTLKPRSDAYGKW